jgi:16S rRNA processing protein RimM
MDKILIGKIVNTHGIKGELKILSETDFKAERYQAKTPLFIEYDEQMIEVYTKSYRPHQGFDLLTLNGLEDINLVEKFRGCLIYAEDHPIKTLKSNEFQINQLLNMIVIQKGKVVGTVTGIRVYPQGDYLEISCLDKRICLIPFRDEFILSIDHQKKFLEIVDMEGLL